MQAKALELLLAHIRAMANTSTPSSSSHPASSSPTASGPPPQATAAAAAAALKPHMKAIAAALTAAVAGVGMKPEHQADALKAAVGVVEGLKRVHPSSSKLGEVMGPERISQVAKAVCTVRVSGGCNCTNQQMCV